MMMNQVKPNERINPRLLIGSKIEEHPDLEESKYMGGIS